MHTDITGDAAPPPQLYITGCTRMQGFWTAGSNGDELFLVFSGVHNTSYPRTDPVVISVVISPDNTRMLLGRKKQFPSTMYSCLAGFMEPGESVEEAARREIKEESGVDVGEVTYVSSQPWPYPAVLMIGCVSRAKTEMIEICTEELEDAKWFDIEDVRKGINNESSVLAIPPPETIAHQLIKSWLSKNNSRQSKI